MPDSPLTLTDVQLRILRRCLALHSSGGGSAWTPTYLTRGEAGLLDAGLVEQNGSRLRITAAGREALEGSDG